MRKIRFSIYFCGMSDDTFSAQIMIYKPQASISRDFDESLLQQLKITSINDLIVYMKTLPEVAEDIGFTGFDQFNIDAVYIQHCSYLLGFQDDKKIEDIFRDFPENQLNFAFFFVGGASIHNETGYRFIIHPNEKIHEHKVKDSAPNVQENVPFMRSFKNAARRMRPDEVEKWLKVFLRGFNFAKQKEAKNLLKHPGRVLRETFRAAMAICGCDADEIRYLYGSAPESVFARNYCAYDDPRELAKLAAMLDRYIFSLMGTPDATLDFKINRSGEDHAIAAAPGGRISGDLTVDLSKVSHDNLETGRELIIDFKANDTIFVTTELDLEEN